MQPELLELANPDLIYAFKANVSLPTLVAGFSGMMFGAAAAAGVSIPAVARYILPQPVESMLSDNLPFQAIADDGETILCQDGTLVKIVEVGGRDTTFLTNQERESYTLARKNWMDNIAETGVKVRVIVTRDLMETYVPTEHQDDVLKNLAARWNDSFQQTFRNRQIIILSYSSKTAKREKSIERLEEAVQGTLSTLAPYGPRVMNQRAEDPQSRPLTALARIISPITRPTPAGVDGNVAEMLTADQVDFGGSRGTIRFRSGEEDLYCCAIGIRRMGDYSDEGFAEVINAVPFEVIVSNCVEPYGRGRATLKLAHGKRLALGSKFSASVSQQFSQAEELVEGTGEETGTLANYHQTIFIFARSEEELYQNEQEIKRLTSAYGINAVREGVVSQAAWFSMFPGFQSWPRIYALLSHNIATQITLDKAPRGLPSSDWGPGPIALFRTATGSAYQFQFHVSQESAAVAHGVTIGPTGGGKTTLITFLGAMAMRHPNLRVFVIDRHGGAYIFTNAVGGKYAVFDGSTIKGTHSALNPFQLPNTQDNRRFLNNFLQAIADVDDADSIEEISFAVDALYDMPGLPKSQRSLQAVFDACFSKSKPLRKKLQKWVEPSMLGNLFNAEEDTLDLSSNRLVTLDFTKIYENDDVARAVILYLMHRIQSTITDLKCPALIFIDETEPIVQHPMFRKFFLQMLQEYRKRGAAVISAFQRPEAITQAGLGEAIRGQAQTVYFLPNQQAQPEEYADWGLSENQWAYIKGQLPAARYLNRSIMVKRATGESVILDTDLRPLGEYLNIFRSDEASKERAEALMEEHGDNWLQYYLNS